MKLHIPNSIILFNNYFLMTMMLTGGILQVKIKRAASNAAGKLKTLKTKKQLNESRTTLGVKKRKIDESQMEEKSGNNIFSKLNKGQVFIL